MKKIIVFAAVFVFILLLTKIANQVPPPPPVGTAFWLKAQTVVQCSKDEITLVDPHQKATHLEKDDNSWPDCGVFHKEDVLDFKLARGEKTKFLEKQPSSWLWKVM